VLEGREPTQARDRRERTLRLGPNGVQPEAERGGAPPSHQRDLSGVATRGERAYDESRNTIHET